MPLLVALSALLLLLAVAAPHRPGDTAPTVSRVERRIAARLARMDALAQRLDAELPGDMVIYRYDADTICDWRGRFPIASDDINPRVMVQRLSNPAISFSSPLAELGEDYSYVEFGSKRYLARKRSAGGRTEIRGLELDPAHLGINVKYAIRPLSSSGGSEVKVDGKPQFKIAYDSLETAAAGDMPLILLSLILFLAAMVALAAQKRTLRYSLHSAGGIILSMAAVYLWGRRADGGGIPVFSPTLYSGGTFLYSLGAVLIVNAAILLTVVCIYLARADFSRRPGVLPAIALVLVLSYGHFALQSIVQNSGINLELYKLDDLNAFSILVLLSFLSLLLCIPLLLSAYFDAFKLSWRISLSLVSALYIASLAGIQGFEKEEDRMEVWAGRIALDRDVSAELQLRRVEEKIASDPLISTLAMVDNSEEIILNRMTDNYLLPLSQDYTISVKILRDGRSGNEDAVLFNRILQEGTPLAEGSVFLFSERPGGRSCYDGFFTFYDVRAGLARMLVELERKNVSGGKGYSRLLGLERAARASLPARYSYARYKEGKLITFRGSYPYPTSMNAGMRSMIYDNPPCHYMADGWAHFVTIVADNEAVLISRRRVGALNYVIMILFMSLVTLLVFSLPAIGRMGRKGHREKRYFRTRITLVLMLSLLLTLVVMAAVSITFVWRRNDANMGAMMSDKISAVQAFVQTGMRQERVAELKSTRMHSVLEAAADNASTDITLYDAGGAIVMTTSPEAFSGMLLGSRVEREAYDMIIRDNKRYAVLKSYVDGTRYYSMFAPLAGPGGRIIGIICAPYAEDGFDFERDAFLHLMTILTVFLILLFLARFMVIAVVNRMFQPLSEMGRLMDSAGDLDTLECIEYDREDEISALVQAYNRMVLEMKESTRKLAQAERDKAWSGMARQVAHEIKNPLTPMKLQLQRLIRLKQRSDDSWQEKFDEVSEVILDHIDILTDTANEFSTFAKLYTEEPVSIDIDALLQEEISMFDNRDNISFDYMGLSGVTVMGPKPQLTRVFVNLIGNAVQALEEKGGGRVLVALRKSSEDGFYDIAVEDDGPGVAAENVDRLFTPNFTTKNGGSGLGLAISRSILDRCGATISYSRSFSLGGACFTIKYPG